MSYSLLIAGGEGSRSRHTYIQTDSGNKVVMAEKIPADRQGFCFFFCAFPVSQYICWG